MDCVICKKTGIDYSDMTTNEVCDDCFNKKLDSEQTDYDIAEKNNYMCSVCNRKLGLEYWIIKDEKVMHLNCSK